MAVIQNIERKKGKGKWVSRLITGLLCIGIPIQIFPYVWMALNSFKSSAEITTYPLSFLPREWYFDGVLQIFDRYNLGHNLYNTAFIVIAVLLIQVPTSAMAGYSLSKMRPKYGNLVLLFILGTMMISGQALMFPLYIMVANLGLLNTKLSVILSSCTSAYAVYLFKGFFDGIPKELQESAVIDGAGNLRIVANIIAPLSKPVFAVTIMRTLMGVYNDYVMPLMFMPNEEQWTLMMRVFNVQNTVSSRVNDVYILLAISTIPIVLIYLFVQNLIAEGIVMTGIKG